MAYGFKTGGRQKGSLNKTTLLQREKLRAVWEAEVDSGKLHQMLGELSPKDYVWAFLKLTGFVLPRATEENLRIQQMAAQLVEEEPVAAAEQPPVGEENHEDDQGEENIFRQDLMREIKPEMLERFRKQMDWSQEQLDEFIRTTPFVVKN